MEDKKILEDIFEQAYKEYKEYDEFLKKESSSIAKGRESFSKFVQENNKDIDSLVEKMFLINEVPAHYRVDLMKLEVRLVTVYDTVKDIIEIPKEIRDEINSMPKQQLVFKIENGKAVELNPEYTKQLRKDARSVSESFVRTLLQISS